MAESFEISVEYANPYRGSRLYTQRGRAFFGRWHPLDVQIDGDEEEIIVREGQEGQLDIFAHTVYGDRTLWRVIAHANQIDFPLEQVTIGLRLIIPKLANVQAALAQTVARSARVSLDGESV